jgi:hypothetical protein
MPNDFWKNIHTRGRGYQSKLRSHLEASRKALTDFSKAVRARDEAMARKAEMNLTALLHGGRQHQSRESNGPGSQPKVSSRIEPVEPEVMAERTKPVRFSDYAYGPKVRADTPQIDNRLREVMKVLYAFAQALPKLMKLAEAKKQSDIQALLGVLQHQVKCLGYLFPENAEPVPTELPSRE